MVVVSIHRLGDIHVKRRRHVNLIWDELLCLLNMLRDDKQLTEKVVSPFFPRSRVVININVHSCRILFVRCSRTFVSSPLTTSRILL